VPGLVGTGHAHPAAARLAMPSSREDELYDEVMLLVPIWLASFVLVLLCGNLYLRLVRLSLRVNLCGMLFCVALVALALHNWFNPERDGLGLGASCSLTVNRLGGRDMEAPVVFAKIVMHWDASQDDIGAITGGINEAYAKRHGYLFERHHDCAAPHRAPQWTKIAVLYHELLRDSQVQWLVWIDTDAVFTNDRIRLESFLSSLNRHVVLAIGPDMDATDRPINTGWMALRYGPESLELLKKVWDCGTDLRLRWRWGHEQTCLTTLMAQHKLVRRQVHIVKEPGVRLFAEDLSLAESHWCVML
jgi:hypothetical protein